MITLLVDDEPYSINALKKHIPWSSLGIQTIITAEDGLEGWEAYQTYSPDLILTDVNMPKWNGLQLVKKIREFNTEVPIIILSGYDEFDYAKEAIHLKVSHYILKPIIHAELVPVISQVIKESATVKMQHQYFEDMQKQFHEALPSLREQFVLDMITGKIKDKGQMQIKFQFFDMNYEMASCGIVMTLELFRLNNDKTFSENDWYLYKFAASNITQEIIRAYGNGYAAMFLEDRLPLLIFGKHAERVKESAFQIANKIIENIAFYLEIPSNIGIGTATGMTRLNQSYKEAKQALTLSSIEGYEKVLAVDNEKNAQHNQFDVISPEETEAIAYELLTGNLEGMRHKWEAIEERLLNLRVSLTYQMMVSFGFLNTILLKITNEIHHELDLQYLIKFNEIYLIQTKEQLAAFVLENLQSICSFLVSHHTSQNEHKYIHTIKWYVKENYPNELTVADISKYLYLSREYISKLFKRETGESISNYITNFRIQEAIKIMEIDRNAMIYEISARVGYTDQNYFCRVFKSVVGLKPSEYMLKLRKKLT